jgi:hypothetical protein
VLLQNDVTSGAIDFGGGSLNSEGYNSIYSNGTYDFVNFPNVRSISAENNWWGTTSPAAGQFTGTVDYNPYLSSNPN